MAIRERMSGNEAVAVAMKQINPDVFGAFPITPSTEVPQYFSKYVADGLVDTEFVTVESEHSSMSTCIGASAAGARAVTATSSAGLAYMWELLYVAASSRLPMAWATVTPAPTDRPINRLIIRLVMAPVAPTAATLMLPQNRPTITRSAALKSNCSTLVRIMGMV